MSATVHSAIEGQGAHCGGAAVHTWPDTHPSHDDGATVHQDREHQCMTGGGAIDCALLQIAAATLNDVEQVRMATANRLGAWDRDGLPDGAERTRAQAILDALLLVETQAQRELERALKVHPLGPWVKETIGIGSKQGARLIAAIGDPAWNGASERLRRGPAELWAYCGLHTVPRDPTRLHAEPMAVPSGRVAASRKRGERANWNAEAKMRAHLVAESCIKQMHSPYREVYDKARAKYADAVHEGECRQCGPSGKPAQPGSPLSLGHQHARALREVAKAVLRDLFLQARVIHVTSRPDNSIFLTPPTTHSLDGNQRPGVGRV